MVDSVLFIGTVIVAITEIVKYIFPRINGAFSIGVAMLVGIAVALVDTHIGVTDITIAQGILIGLSASGVVAVAGKVNSQN